MNINETEEDILEEMINFKNGPNVKRKVSGEFVGAVLFGLAMRIKAAKERKEATQQADNSVGNIAKLREVAERVLDVNLESIHEPFDFDSSEVYHSVHWENDKFFGKEIPTSILSECLGTVWEAQPIARAALGEPCRNCDVGTAEEQSQRFNAFCDANKYVGDDGTNWCSPTCPCDTSIECELKWAQMPYKEGGE